MSNRKRNRTEVILLAILAVVVFGGMALIGVVNGW
jgi:hypothetical protein